jgi:hypothetical protein
MTVPARKHLVTVLDATPDVQHWVDEFIAAARAGAGGWPHPHAEITLTVLPLARFIEAMEESGWELTPGGPIERGTQPGDPVSPLPGPNDGGIYHTMLHNMLGDFH